MRVAIILGSLLLTGCMSTQQKPIPDDPFYAPIQPEASLTPVVRTGSLFEAGVSENLYADTKAFRVGDIVTVNLDESTSAKKSAKTELDKDSSIELATPTVFGSPLSINGNNVNANLSSTNAFAGESDADQSNSLQGSITVNIVQVMANGNFVVRGEKWITINNGDEFIRLTGIIRPDDIEQDNSISSRRVANARIQYSGTGAFSDTQTQGWFVRFFNSPLWPF